MSDAPSLFDDVPPEDLPGYVPTRVPFGGAVAAPKRPPALFGEDRLPDLAEPAERPSGTARGTTIAERFDAFHELNPHVYLALRDLALELVRLRPGRRIGIGMLFEVLRWQRMIRTQGDPYKLNNDYRAHYARLLAERVPELEDAFETRELRAD